MRISDWSSDVCSSDLLVCWLSATIHEGENGACEPGGMPAAAESKYDEGTKMSPFKVVENFKLKRDLVTFLQNSVRSEEHTSELQSLMRISYAVFCLKKKKQIANNRTR